MSKAEKRACQYTGYCRNQSYKDYLNGYRQAEKDIKDELSELFREFMMDCVNDSTDTHILHFVEVFNNKIKEIGNE